MACTCITKECCKKVVYLVLLLLAIADLVSDWMFFRDVAMAKKGLAYGPSRDLYKWLLLAFSITGTGVSVFEMVNLCSGILCEDQSCDLDKVKLCVIWIGDLPLLVVSIFIAACREEAISYFQLAKACLPIAGYLIRIILIFSKSCCKKCTCKCVAFVIASIIGLLVSLGCSVTIFLFTQYERNPDGSLNFKIPHSVVEGKYDHEKYFANVSVYFSHDIFDPPGQQTGLVDANILRLLKIDDVKSAPDDLSINVTINNKLTAADYMIEGVRPAMECFTYDKTTNKIKIPIKGSCSTGFITAPTDVFYFTFHFIKPSPPGLIFGDISYNMKYRSAGYAACQYPNFTIENEVSDHSYKTDEAALQYFRAAGNEVSDNFHIQYTSSTDGKFYHPKDLIDIEEVWRMGFAFCKCTGSLSPNRDAGLLVKC